MIRTFSILFFSVLLLSCESNPAPPSLKIVTNSWIGYAPLYYARQQGQLDDLGIKLVTVVSLGESLQLYRSGVAGAFTGTQYEFAEAYARDPSLTPVILFDRSNGGDLVMGNRTLAELRALDEPVDAYLELGSVNALVLQDFLEANGLGGLEIRYINQDQGRISTLQADQLERPTLITTYFPYNQALEKQGFTELASTRDNIRILVIDALYTSQAMLSQHKEQLQALKQLVDAAIEVAMRDPEAFYAVVADFLGRPGPEAFRAGLDDIEWINQQRDPELDRRLREAGFPTGDLL